MSFNMHLCVCVSSRSHHACNLPFSSPASTPLIQAKVACTLLQSAHIIALTISRTFL